MKGLLENQVLPQHPKPITIPITITIIMTIPGFRV